MPRQSAGDCDRGRSLFHDDVGIRPTQAEGTDRRATWCLGGWFPRTQLLVHEEWTLRESNVAIRGVKI